MMKNVATLILFALFAAFEPNAYAKPEIKFQIQVKGSVAQASRITKLAEIARIVVNSEEFETRVKGASFQKGQAFSYSSESGPQVYQKLLDGAELSSAKDGLWQLSYKFEAKHQKCLGFGRWKKCTALVYGWTDPTTKDVFINSVPWDERDDCGIVGTIVHEQSHKLGYDHPFDYTSTREYSIPYALGNLAATICRKYL